MKIAAVIGGSGSGKSTVLDRISAHFGARVTVLSLDNYYLPIERQPVDENGQTNFDQPEGIDHVQLVADVDQLRRGEPVELKTYSFNKDIMASQVLHIQPAEWLIVEGLFALTYPEIQKRVDVKIYIDAPEPVRLARRIARDAAERGYNEEEVTYQWKNHVLPSEAMHISCWKSRVDVVVDNTNHWRDGIDQVIATMEAFQK